MRVLLIEDEIGLGKVIMSHLATRGYAVDWATDIASGEAYSKTGVHGIMLLDLNLPDGSGLLFLKSLRRDGDKRPVMIISARDQLSDRLEGLNSGADDYINKPFELDELVARLEAIRRRCSGSSNPLLVIGEASIDTANRQATYDGQNVHLTSREWALLIQLGRRPGAILSKPQLEEALYDFGAEVESNTVEVYISRLRRKFTPQLIETVRSVGYRLQVAR